MGSFLTSSLYLLQMGPTPIISIAPKATSMREESWALIPLTCVGDEGWSGLPSVVLMEVALPSQKDTISPPNALCYSQDTSQHSRDTWGQM